jgi:hypothetical protein
MPGQARAIGAWTSAQCLTNASWDIPGFRASSEALLIIKPPRGATDSGSALLAIFAVEADAASPAKRIRVRRRVEGVTLFFEGNEAVSLPASGATSI